MSKKIENQKITKQEEEKKTKKKTTKKRTTKKKWKVWRPTKLTPETVKKIEEAFSLDCTVSEACFYAWISRETYYTFIKKYPEYADRFEALRNKPVLLARQELVKGMKWNPEMALKYLERKRKNEFSLKQEIEQNTTIQWEIKIKLPEDLDNQEE